MVSSGDESERFSETVSPGNAVVDERARDDWASATHGGSMSAKSAAAILRRTGIRIQRAPKQREYWYLLANFNHLTWLLRRVT
jgi:hypothetical protein